MSQAQTAHDRLQKFVLAARRGQHDPHFTSPDRHCCDLAQLLSDFAEFIPLELLAGAASFMQLAHNEPKSARVLIASSLPPQRITPRPLNSRQPTGLRRSPK
jgi:hypothetical protein